MSLAAEHTLIDELLAEQQNLSAVERFSQRHEKAETPIQAQFYRDLIPLSKPGAGEQYAFQVDLDACSGCKACVSACHSLNGLDEAESWRDIGSLRGGRNGDAMQQTVTTACHHCADPACANGCPTLAYEKDAETGIVHHLDDQCMGCRYCELKCPYDVPKFNDALGIVRKCDMCQSRLAEGEAPACVQACPNEAIKIKVVSYNEIESRSTASNRLLPGTVTSDYTRPTTEFLNANPTATSAPVDDGTRSETPAHGHFPLVWMLVFTQAGAGVIIVDWLVRMLSNTPTSWVNLAIGVGFAFAGLAGSVLHLGRPTQAWRAFLGWRKSWLSREIIAFGPWSGACAGFLAAVFFNLPTFIIFSAGAAATFLGIAGVFCSVMVYVDTRRPLWNLKATLLRFFGTAVTTGLILSPLAPFAAIPMLILLIHESRIAAGKVARFENTSYLMTEALPRTTNARFILGTLAAAAVFFSPITAVVLWLLSELAGRSLFFRAVDEPKMPGVVRPHS